MIYSKVLLMVLTVAMGAGCSSGSRATRGDVNGTDSSDTSATSTDSASDDSDTLNNDTDSNTGVDTDTGPITSPECDNVGELYCDSECMLPITDDHCRACNRACSAGRVCKETDGTWDCGCPDDTIICNGKCTDPKTDAMYCGASGTCTGLEIGVNCGLGGVCVKGLCKCDTTHTNCDGECVDTKTDARYCGSTPDKCGVQCMAGGVCVDGGCECPASASLECNVGCVDPMTSNAACGGCVESAGEACDTDNGYTCQEGVCDCAPGLTKCDGNCVDTTADPANCGGCYNAGSGPGIACGYVDPPGNTIPQSCFAGTCVNGPCDTAVMGTVCDGLTYRLKSACFASDDHFTAAGIKCDNNGNQIPKNTAVCYEILNVPDFEEFRCWWSARNLTVNNTLMMCSNAGTNYLPLPPSVGGSYCVYFPPSNQDGAETDGFAMGIR